MYSLSDPYVGAVMKHTFITSEKREEILATVRNHPELGYNKIAEVLGISISAVMTAAKRAGIVRARGKASPAYRKETSNA